MNISVPPLKELFSEYHLQFWINGYTNIDEIFKILDWKDNHKEKIRLTQFISTIPALSIWYATVIMGIPWPPGEKAIASDPGYAYWYAMYIIEGPWPPGEKAIASHPMYAYYYAKYVINVTWPPGEKVIVTDPKWKQKYEEDFGVKL